MIHLFTITADPIITDTRRCDLEITTLDVIPYMALSTFNTLLVLKLRIIQTVFLAFTTQKNWCEEGAFHCMGAFASLATLAC